MNIAVKKIDDGYVVSQGGTWLEGVYATEGAARLACRVAPDRLHEIWQRVLAANPDGVITEGDLS